MEDPLRHPYLADFARHANKDSLHFLDWRRFYLFMFEMAKRDNMPAADVLDLYAYLKGSGFPEGTIRQLTSFYELGMRMLDYQLEVAEP